MKKKRLKRALIILLIPVLSISVYTFAKYVIEEYHSYFESSKDFYFTSNILKENNPLYQVNNWMGIGQFTISYDLLSMKNDYIYSDYDISYETSVICPNDVVCEIDKPTGNIYSSTHRDKIIVTVSPTRLYSEGEKLDIQLSAKSTNPYVKNLYAKFEYIVGKQGVTYEIEDESNRPYFLLKVTNAINYCKVTTAFDGHSVGDIVEVSEYLRLSNLNKSYCVSQSITLDFNPNIVYLDTTSEIINYSTYSNTLINQTNYINHLNFGIGPLSTIAVKFYKQNYGYNYTYPIVNNSSIIDVNIQDPS